MALPTMLPVVVGSVADIEMAHEFLKVPQRGLNEEMKVVGHQHISQDFGLISILGMLQKFKKS